MKIVRRKLVFPFIRQATMMECGTTSLAMIFKYYGLHNIRSVLTQLAHIDTQGTNMMVLSKIGEMFGFETAGYRLKPENLDKIALPAIAHYEGNHFVVIYGYNKTHIKIADPATGKHKMPITQFTKKWNGVVLCFKPTAHLFKNKNALELIDKIKAQRKDFIKHFYLSTLAAFKGIINEILLASLAIQFIVLSLPLFTQIIIDKVLVHQNKKLLFVILLGMALAFFTNILFHYIRNVLLAQFKVQFELNFFSKFFDHFIHLPQPYFDSMKREELLMNFKENLTIRQVLSPSILQALIEFLLVFTYLGFLLFLNVNLAILSFLFVGAYILVAVYFSPQLAYLSNKVFNENGKAMGTFLDSLLGIQNIKLLGAEYTQYSKWQNEYRRTLNQVLIAEQRYTNLVTLLKAFFLLSQISVFWYGAYLSFNGELSIGQYIAFITIFTMITQAAGNVSNIWFLITELSVVFERLNTVFLQKREMADNIKQQRLIASPDIHFKDVSFRYTPHSKNYVLRNITFTIRHGEFVGIVGRNGSGKSTLVKLLTKLYEDYEGEILVGDSSLKDIHSHFYRKKVVMFPQEVHLFNDTIKANVLYGNPDATIEDVIQATKMADLYEFIKDNYLGLNLRIGEFGTKLSGGQKLKIAFARLFLSNPEVIILDEASSALDVETEEKIFRNIKTFFSKATIISIAHRMNTIMNADKIFVMDKGKIVEMGDHQTLLSQEGIYSNFLKTYLNS